MVRFAPLLIAALTVAAAPIAAVAQEAAAGRFELAPDGQGFLRLDTLTGDLSFCSLADGRWQCAPVETRTPAAIDNDRLLAIEQQMVALRGIVEAALAAVGDQAPGEDLAGRIAALENTLAALPMPDLAPITAEITALREQVTAMAASPAPQFPTDIAAQLVDRMTAIEAALEDIDTPDIAPPTAAMAALQDQLAGLRDAPSAGPEDAAAAIQAAIAMLLDGQLRLEAALAALPATDGIEAEIEALRNAVSELAAARSDFDTAPLLRGLEDLGARLDTIAAAQDVATTRFDAIIAAQAEVEVALAALASEHDGAAGRGLAEALAAAIDPLREEIAMLRETPSQNPNLDAILIRLAAIEDGVAALRDRGGPIEPGPAQADLSARLDAITAAQAGLAERLDAALEGAIADPGPVLAEIEARLAELQTAGAELAANMAALQAGLPEERPDPALAEIDARLDRIEAMLAAPPVALAGIEARLAELQTAGAGLAENVAALQAGPPEEGPDPALAEMNARLDRIEAMLAAPPVALTEIEARLAELQTAGAGLAANVAALQAGPPDGEPDPALAEMNARLDRIEAMLAEPPVAVAELEEMDARLTELAALVAASEPVQTEPLMEGLRALAARQDGIQETLVALERRGGATDAALLSLTTDLRDVAGRIDDLAGQLAAVPGIETLAGAIADLQARIDERFDADAVAREPSLAAIAAEIEELRIEVAARAEPRFDAAGLETALTDLTERQRSLEATLAELTTALREAIAEPPIAEPDPAPEGRIPFGTELMLRLDALVGELRASP